MKRTILIVLCLAAAGTFAIAQAQEDTVTPDCGNFETVDGECCCGGTVDGCTEDCDSCDECDCGSECEDCTGCEETDSGYKDCTGCDCGCDDSTSEEEEIHHCGGCH
ncbi:MAG: hypothetical protein KAT09_04020 [Candidatus Aegiribacteria sp.]|nr:hypothetical protein [Candidatus Aegiribacteria sp.]